MKRTIEDRCPHCNSFSIVDKGERLGDMPGYVPEAGSDDAWCPVYECSECGKVFVKNNCKPEAGGRVG